MTEEKPRLKLTPERFEQEVAEEIAKDLRGVGAQKAGKTDQQEQDKS